MVIFDDLLVVLNVLLVIVCVLLIVFFKSSWFHIVIVVLAARRKIDVGFSEILGHLGTKSKILSTRGLLYFLIEHVYEF